MIVNVEKDCKNKLTALMNYTLDGRIVKFLCYVMATDMDVSTCRPDASNENVLTLKYG